MYISLAWGAFPCVDVVRVTAYLYVAHSDVHLDDRVPQGRMVILYLELRLGCKPPYPEGRKTPKSVGQELCRSWVDAPYNLPYGAIHFDRACDFQYNSESWVHGRNFAIHHSISRREKQCKKDIKKVDAHLRLCLS